MTDQSTPPAADPDVEPGPGELAIGVLTRLSPDPDVQVAIWRVWYRGTGLLEPSVSRLITEAYVLDHAALRSTR